MVVKRNQRNKSQNRTSSGPTISNQNAKKSGEEMMKSSSEVKNLGKKDGSSKENQDKGHEGSSAK